MREKLRVLDLFSGIGGFSLGLERTGGFETVAFCEIEKFPRAVLAKHWPEAPCYEDVQTLTAERLAADGIAVDAITGGFPCQDISVAGNQRGIIAGTRSGLWGEFSRLIDELRPRFVIVENVANLLNGPSERPGGWFGRVLGDLAEIGYDAEWHSLGGTYAGVPQQRPRVWIVAYPAGTMRGAVFYPNAEHVECYRQGLHEPRRDVADADNKGRGSCAVSVLGNIEWTEIPDRERSGDRKRVPLGLDRYKSLGNTVIPQIPGDFGGQDTA